MFELSVESSRGYLVTRRFGSFQALSPTTSSQVGHHTRLHLNRASQIIPFYDC